MTTTGEATPTVTTTITEVETTTEPADFVNTLQDTAVDKLPLVPGVLELVGIGYTGWFAYKNLIFKPEREALIEKIKNTYKDILGTS